MRILIILCICFTPLFTVGQEVKVDPQSFLEYFEKGNKLYDQGYLPSAIQEYDSTIEAVPFFFMAYYNRGLAKIGSGDRTGGCDDLRTAARFGGEKTIKKKHRWFYLLCHVDGKPTRIDKELFKQKGVTEENNYKPVYARKDSIRGALRPERTSFDVTSYDLTVRIQPRSKSIEGKNIIYFTAKAESKTIQIDLFDNYTIDSILWRGQNLPYTREDQALFIEFPDPLVVEKKEVLTIIYNGQPRNAPDPPWDGGFVWKKKRFKWWCGVSCEHLGASSWWPNKDYLGDRIDSMTIRMQVPKKYQAVCNGELKSTKMVDKKYKQYNWFVSYPINNYNVTFYMGDFVNFSDSLGIGKKLDFYVRPHNLDKAKKHFKQNKEVLDFYEKTFGPYAFWNDGFGMVESPYEGMEHQGAIAYGNKYGKKELFPPYLNKTWDYIIVHENAHEWWGNSVTVGDMADAWIHEGFATYSEMLFLESKYGYKYYQLEMKEQMNRVFNYWPMVGPKDVNDNSFAGGDIYTKGASMLHSLRCTIHDDTLFFNIIKEFYTQNQLSVVTTHDFIDLVNEKTGENYQPFFNKYLYDTELPELAYTMKTVDQDLYIVYRWEGVEKDFKLPFCILPNNTDEGIRIVGDTEWQIVKIPNCNHFGLSSEYSPLKKVPKHAFTYFQSKQKQFKNSDELESFWNKIE